MPVPFLSLFKLLLMRCLRPFVCSAQIPWTRWLIYAEIYCSQFWRLDDQGTSTVEWGPLLTWRLLASSHSGRLDAHLSDILKPLKSDCVFKWIAFYYCCQSGRRVDIAHVCTNCSELLVLSSCQPTYSIMKRKKFSGTGFSVAKWTNDPKLICFLHPKTVSYIHRIFNIAPFLCSYSEHHLKVKSYLMTVLLGSTGHNFIHNFCSDVC